MFPGLNKDVTKVIMSSSEYPSLIRLFKTNKSFHKLDNNIFWKEYVVINNITHEEDISDKSLNELKEMACLWYVERIDKRLTSLYRSETDLLRGFYIDADFLYFLVMEGHLENVQYIDFVGDVVMLHSKEQISEMLHVYFNELRVDIRGYLLGWERHINGIFHLLEIFTCIEMLSEEIFSDTFKQIDVERKILHNTENLDPVKVLAECAYYTGGRLDTQNFVYYTGILSNILGFDINEEVKLLEEANDMAMKTYNWQFDIKYVDCNEDIEMKDFEDVDIFIFTEGDTCLNIEYHTHE